MENIAVRRTGARSTSSRRTGDGAWQPLAAGTAIGHKKIDRIAPVTVSRVRLRVLDAVGTPEIKCFAVYGR